MFVHFKVILQVLVETCALELRHGAQLVHEMLVKTLVSSLMESWKDTK